MEESIEQRVASKVREELDKLSQAEASEAFQFFKDLLFREMSVGMEILLVSRSISSEEKLQLLTALQEKYSILHKMPGARFALQQELVDLAVKSEASKQKTFELRNAKSIRRWQDWKRFEELKQNGSGEG